MDKQQQVYAMIEKHYRDNRRQLIKSLTARTGSPHNAEDVVQEAFTRALTYWKSYEPEAYKFSAWFSHILENTARSFNKAERVRGMTVEIHEEEFETFNPNPYFTRYLNEIKKDVAALPKDLSYIAQLNFFEQLTPHEISQIVDRNPATIRSDIKRIRDQLKKKYGREIYA